MGSSVAYLGYRIDKEGLHPLADKVKAVKEAPQPRNVTELKSFLGLLTYYGKFLPHLPSVLAPLYELLRQNMSWHWGPRQEDAFKKAKELLTSSQVLVHFDPKLNLILACDASSYGVGAVLAHRMSDGMEKPIAFVSRTLTEAERRYAQIEREGLACVFGVTKFHAYLYGRHFTLITDHKPLTSLFSEHRGVPAQASARTQRWALTLACYEYTLEARPTTKHGNADAMSRLPLKVTPRDTPQPPEFVLLLDTLSGAPVTCSQIQRWTRQDPVLAWVLRYTQLGWPQQCPEEKLKPFWSRKTELALLDGCILWGSRVVVPEAGRSQLLEELHDGHPGISRMKALARTIVWWPGIDQDVEDTVNQCSACQLVRPAPPVAPLQPWTWPARPWSRLHVDYAGPFLGHMFLVIIDAYSKWIEAIPLPAATTRLTIQQLRTIFARFGIPDTVVTDNGACFVSSEFEQFLLENGICHQKSPPYHPASNGLAERAVQILKQGLKKIRNGTIEERLSKLLFNYRITPQSTTGISPAKLLFGRNLRSRLDRVKPDTSRKVEYKQQLQKFSHDSHASNRFFVEGEEVYARNFRHSPPWVAGKIIKATGLSFKIKLRDGRIIRRHQDHIRKLKDTNAPVGDPSCPSDGFADTLDLDRTNTPNESLPAVEPDPPRRNPPRDRHPPHRYCPDDYRS